MASEGWACATCTFINADPLHLACGMCGTPAPLSGPRWEYEGDAGWEPYPHYAQAVLAAAYADNTCTPVSLGRYAVDLVAMVQTNTQSGYTRHLRCIHPDGSRLPPLAPPVVAALVPSPSPSPSPVAVAYIPAPPTRTKKSKAAARVSARAAKRAKGLAPSSSASASASAPARPPSPPLPEPVPELAVVAALRSAAAALLPAAQAPPPPREEWLAALAALHATIDAPAVDVVAETATDACAVCCMEFGAEVSGLTAAACGHTVLCTACFGAYINHKVADGDVMPWIPCPGPTCQAHVAVADLDAAALTPSDLAALIATVAAKRFGQYRAWIACDGDGCHFGFVQSAAREDEAEAVARESGALGPDDRYPGEERTCLVCRHVQLVKRPAPAEDDSIAQMLADGTMRLCPKCEQPTMKDRGICNVIMCDGCSVWWNWDTRETGRTAQELKQRARRNGTLWGAGELAYQQRLERENLPAFIDLLAKNGITYDPNYRRGS